MSFAEHFAMSPIRSHDPRAVRVIRVLLGSPGDLGPERRAAREAVEEINRTIARPAGYQVDLVGWEDTLSSVGRPQAVINEELDTCQVFIGLIWQRWGTPPVLDGAYTSGFEEEYLRSRERLKNDGAPFMRLFFKDIDASKLEDAGPELRKVLDFKKRVIDEKAILFQTFDTAATFAQHVRIGLADYINRLSESDQADQTPATGNSAGAEPSSSLQQAEPTAGTVGETKLLEDVAAMIANASGDGVDAVTIARLRNLALALGGSSNDTTSLGPHDANLLYRAKADLNFSDRELSALADAGLDALTDENAPLWFWLADRSKGFPDWLLFSTVIGPEKRRINAFKVLRMVKYALPAAPKLFSREELLGWWFGDISDRLKVAALEYLADHGTLNEVEAIRTELDKVSYGTKGAAQKALIALLIREDMPTGADVLIEASDVSLDRDFLTAVTSVLSQLSNEKLIVALGAKLGGVRLRALQCLDERDALSESAAVQLLQDASLEIRTAAFLILEARGRIFTEEEAESYLVRKKANSLFSFGSQGEEGREALDAFKERMQIAQNAKTLELSSQTKPFSSDKSYFALCRKEPKKRLGALREHFDDRFAGFYDDYVAIIRSAYSDKSGLETVDKLVTDSEKFWKRNWMRNALNIIVSKGKKEDLDRVRKALDEDAVDPKKDDIVFLEKYGSFEDIARVCKIDADYRSTGMTSTILGHVRDRRRVAGAVLTLAKDNIVNLLASELPADVIPSVIAEAKQKSFRAISGAQLDKLLFHSSDGVRKATVLKILVVDPAKTIRAKLDRYLNAEQYRFYNVIFWLDLGEAFPIALVREIAAAELRKVD